MKTLLTVFLCILTLSSHAQEYLSPSNNEIRNLIVVRPDQGMSYCQYDQGLLYSHFLVSSRTQILHLLEVMHEEEDHSYRHNLYKELLKEKILLHILVEQMNKKMKKNTLYELYRLSELKKNSSVMGIDGVSIDLGEEISSNLHKFMTLSRFKEISIEHLKEELLSDTLKDLAKGVFKSVISGEAKKNIAKILAGTVTKEAFKRAILSTGLDMTSHILAGVAKSSLISLVTLPLHGYRYSDEDLWIDVIEKAPVLLLNPDWKSNDHYGPRAAIDWEIHCRAMVWKPEHIEKAFDKFLRKIEKNFYSKVEIISTMEDFNNSRSLIISLPKDGTYVRPKIYPQRVL